MGYSDLQSALGSAEAVVGVNFATLVMDEGVQVKSKAIRIDLPPNNAMYANELMPAVGQNFPLRKPCGLGGNWITRPLRENEGTLFASLQNFIY